MAWKSTMRRWARVASRRRCPALFRFLSFPFHFSFPVSPEGLCELIPFPFPFCSFPKSCVVPWVSFPPLGRGCWTIEGGNLNGEWVRWSSESVLSLLRQCQPERRTGGWAETRTGDGDGDGDGAGDEKKGWWWICELVAVVLWEPYRYFEQRSISSEVVLVVEVPGTTDNREERRQVCFPSALAVHGQCFSSAERRPIQPNSYQASARESCRRRPPLSPKSNALWLMGPW